MIQDIEAMMEKKFILVYTVECWTYSITLSIGGIMKSYEKG